RIGSDCSITSLRAGLRVGITPDSIPYLRLQPESERKKHFRKFWNAISSPFFLRPEDDFSRALLNLSSSNFSSLRSLNVDKKSFSADFMNSSAVLRPFIKN